MWTKTGTDDHFFPKALAVTPNNLDRTRKTCSLFQLAGTFVAKSIIDDRLIDMPLSPLMWDLVLGKVSKTKLTFAENEPLRLTPAQHPLFQHILAIADVGKP